MPTHSEKWVASTAYGPSLDVVFKIFSCSRRREVLALLADRELYAYVLADLVSVDPGQLSRWMKLMTSAGLVEWRSDGRTHIYGLTDLIEVRLEPPHTAIAVRTCAGELTLRFPVEDFARVLDALHLRLGPDAGE
ncbi:MAG: winged helix-turn-helix transcriptional regulator [Phycisphaerales bacterium]|nr:winged helix-turn-helix transcriptional regulator [Phycisphaerales bacterium]